MSKETIVVVDDEAPARSAVARLLTERGYTVHALASGQEAIDFANTTPFDVLLTDFRMPGGLDGLTTVRAVRRINPQVVAIIMTGHSSIDLAIQSLNLGVHGFVVKPFTAFELTRTIEQTIAQQTLTRENIKMRALVEIFNTTQALISANVDSARLPRLALELAMSKITADQATLFLFDENRTENANLDVSAIALHEEGIRSDEHPGDPQHDLFFPDLESFNHTNHGQVAYYRQLAQQANDSHMTVIYIDNQDVKFGQGQMLPPQHENCIMAVPLTAQGRNVGALIMERRGEDQSFSELDLQTAAILASQAAIAIDNTRLYRRLARVEALHEADKLRSEFVATVSHELRTPLTSIKGYATTLLRPDVQWNNKTGTEYLSIISEECDKLMQLIDNILEVSRIEAGALRIFAEPIQLYEVLERAVTEARRRSPEVVIDLKTPPLAEIPFVLADPQRIIQVLRNLIQNGIKYSPMDPHITVLVRPPEPTGPEGREMVEISVTDNGVGISPEDKPKIFERFYRVDTGPARRTEGTGLGLAICRGIVEAHGGSIWVESEGLGKGSTFYFTLPVSDISRELELD
ncbi:MAG TPA: ATP-binding protein [Chloroflexia bacterium]|nr:ATP-binding protein [Chloroflexia bacterium]